MKKLILFFFFITLFACSYDDNSSLASPEYKRDKTSNFNTLLRYYSYNLNEGTEYPLTASATVEYINKDKVYQGAFFYVGATKSSFMFDKGALTPPSGTPDRADVDITYSIDKTENGEMIYTFGPHGSVFDPPAIIAMDYSAIDNGTLPTLYYIEDDGTYTEQPPEQINATEKWVTIKIYHFSRYAMSYGR